MKVFFVTILCFSSMVFATDRFEDEILCSPISGLGFHVAIQTNATAWIKRASIRTSSDANTEIGSFSIPLTQPLISTPGFIGTVRDARYSVEFFELSMAVEDINGQLVLGEGYLSATLPSLFQPIVQLVNCKRLK